MKIKHYISKYLSASVLFSLFFLSMLVIPTVVTASIDFSRPGTKPPGPSVNFPGTPVPNPTNFYTGAFYMPKPVQPTHQWHSLITYNRTPEAVAENNRMVRRPMLGYYSGADTLPMDWTIKMAVENGLRYFVFDEYWSASQSDQVMGDSINSFLNASYSQYMDFAVNLVSISAKDATTARQKFLGEIATKYSQYFQRSNYLTVDQKPVVYIHHTNVFKLSPNNVAGVAAILNDFETAVGQEVYWIYVAAKTDDGQPRMQNYKDMGFDAISPYYIAPGITMDIYDPDTNPDGTELPVDHRIFSLRSFELHQELAQLASNVGLKFISTATSNYDEQNRYFVDPFIATGRYTSNPQFQNYTELLTDVRDDVQNGGPYQMKNGQPMLQLGAWNEWGEGNMLEPGKSPLSADGEDYKLLNSTSQILHGNFSGPENYSNIGYKNYTPSVSSTNIWSFGLEDIANAIYVAPGTTNIVTNSNFGTIKIDQGTSALVEIPANLDVSNLSKVIMSFSSYCGASNPNCVQTIVLTAYTTNCSSDNPSSCSNSSTPNESERVFLSVDDDCVNTVGVWYKCEFTPDPAAFQNRLERLRFNMVLDAGVALPRAINIGKVWVTE